MKKKFTKEDIIEYLKSLDNSLEHRITLVCLGGTVLSLLNIKHCSIDMDFNYITNEEEPFREKAKINAIKKGINPESLHLFDEEQTKSLTEISDYLIRTENFKEVKFKNINLKLMNIYDLILTKIMRFEGRDIVDLRTIVSKLLISEELLERRFLIIYPYRDSKENFKKNYQEFKSLYGKYLNKSKNKTI